MNEDGHRRALEELPASRAKLDPAADLRLYVEACHGMAIHAVAAGLPRRHGVDLDQHQGTAVAARGARARHHEVSGDLGDQDPRARVPGVARSAYRLWLVPPPRGVKKPRKVKVRPERGDVAEQVTTSSLSRCPGHAAQIGALPAPGQASG